MLKDTTILHINTENNYENIYTENSKYHQVKRKYDLLTFSSAMAESFKEPSTRNTASSIWLNLVNITFVVRISKNRSCWNASQCNGFKYKNEMIVARIQWAMLLALIARLCPLMFSNAGLSWVTDLLQGVWSYSVAVVYWWWMRLMFKVVEGVPVKSSAWSNVILSLLRAAVTQALW